MTNETTPSLDVDLTDQSGAFFTTEMMKNAIMTELAEARAKRGYCPKCHAQDLRHINSDIGMAFHQCASCGTVAVLSA